MNANAERSARKVDLSSSGEEVIGAIDDTMMTYSTIIITVRIHSYCFLFYDMMERCKMQQYCSSNIQLGGG
jgi:hypothetical protein